jgi:glutathione S-transferase
MLSEKALAFELVEEKVWERRPGFAQLNPAMQVPVLQDGKDVILAEYYAIEEYLEEQYPKVPLIKGTILQKAEIRRIASWFDNKFYHEVSRYQLKEKVIRYHTGGSPSTEVLRACKQNITTHLDYIGFLTENQRYLAGDNITLADITAAAHLSMVDYLGGINWRYHPAAKEWYALIKSRPSFRPLLEDRIKGFTPPEHYSNPDF